MTILAAPRLAARWIVPGRSTIHWPARILPVSPAAIVRTRVGSSSGEPRITSTRPVTTV